MSLTAAASGFVVLLLTVKGKVDLHLNDTLERLNVSLRKDHRLITTDMFVSFSHMIFVS